MHQKLFKIWRSILPFLFVIFLIHFLKDLTQDILKINTPLDLLGDAKEDLSFLSEGNQRIYFYGLGGLSLLSELFLIISIPFVLKRKEITKLEKLVFLNVAFLAIFFATAILLDPRF